MAKSTKTAPQLKVPAEPITEFEVTEGGTLRIRTRAKLGRAMVTIANTVPAEPSRPGSGMALKNVRERLHLMLRGPARAQRGERRAPPARRPTRPRSARRGR